jgi:hypothetical protein
MPVTMSAGASIYIGFALKTKSARSDSKSDRVDNRDLSLVATLLRYKVDDGGIGNAGERFGLEVLNMVEEKTRKKKKERKKSKGHFVFFL